MKLEKGLNENKEILEETKFNPYYSTLSSGLGERIEIEGKSYINLASNNYLGLADDRRVKDAIILAVEKYGASLCGTPIAVGYSDIMKKLESKLSKFVGVEESILLPSCYQANNGIFKSIVGEKDIIIFDHYVHSSLVQGIESAKGKKRVFLHNDLEHLERILSKSSTYEKIWVVTESVFSTEGTIAPGKEIYELCRKYNATFIVDDSHGIGVIGKSGKGFLEECGIQGSNIIYIASLGKGVANLGGIIGGDRKTMEYLRYFLPHLIYSTALPPMILAGIEKVIDIIEEEFEDISKKLWENKNRIGEALTRCGYEIVHSKSPINSIKGGDKITTIKIAKKFFEKGILVTPFIEPSTPKDEGRVRLIAGANLTSETVDEIIRVIEEIK